jgi:hypothetical protein
MKLVTMAILLSLLIGVRLQVYLFNSEKEGISSRIVAKKSISSNLHKKYKPLESNSA